MGQAIDFPGSNCRLGPPEGVSEEEVYTMNVYRGQGHFVSCWYLTDTEIEEIIKSRCVWLAVMGNGAPPTYVGSLDNIKNLLDQ